MGMWMSKDENLDFFIPPSREISGPLGLGDPESTELERVEEETLIPSLMHDQLRLKQCLKLWEGWSSCKKRYYWASLLFCHDQFKDALSCNKKYFEDPEYYEEMKQLYLKLRSEYRRTGLEQRVVRS